MSGMGLKGISSTLTLRIGIHINIYIYIQIYTYNTFACINTYMEKYINISMYVCI